MKRLGSNDDQADQTAKLPLSKNFMIKYTKMYIHMSLTLQYSQQFYKDELKAMKNSKILLKVNGLKIKEANLKTYLTEYFAKIPASFIDTFGMVDELIEKACYSVQPIWITLNNSDINKGLCVYCRDNSLSGKINIDILHISALQIEDTKLVIESVVEYLWSNTITEQIKVKLAHKLVFLRWIASRLMETWK